MKLEDALRREETQAQHMEFIQKIDKMTHDLDQAIDRRDRAHSILMSEPSKTVLAFGGCEKKTYNLIAQEDLTSRGGLIQEQNIVVAEESLASMFDSLREFFSDFGSFIARSARYSDHLDDNNKRLEHYRARVELRVLDPSAQRRRVWQVKRDNVSKMLVMSKHLYNLFDSVDTCLSSLNKVIKVPSYIDIAYLKDVEGYIAHLKKSSQKVHTLDKNKDLLKLQGEIFESVSMHQSTVHYGTFRDEFIKGDLYTLKEAGYNSIDDICKQVDSLDKVYEESSHVFAKYRKVMYNGYPNIAKFFGLYDVIPATFSPKHRDMLIKLIREMYNNIIELIKTFDRAINGYYRMIIVSQDALCNTFSYARKISTPK